MAASRTHSRLPHFLATLYGLAIVYASLQPFAPWMSPPPGTLYFLFAPWPPKWVRYDVVTNFLAYVPFGFFVALVPSRMQLPARLAIAIGAAAFLSFTMEWLQMYLPTRDASVADVLSNSSGAALGAVVAVAFARSDRALQSLVRPSAQLQRAHAYRAAAVAGSRERFPARAGRTPRLGRADGVVSRRAVGV